MTSRGARSDHGASVRIIDAVPELALKLSDEERALAGEELVAALLTGRPGRWQAPFEQLRGRCGFGFLGIEGRLGVTSS